jgi:glycosyltransferase involved in cell wall biosynthesis
MLLTELGARMSVLVSVILMSYNHEPYLKEALESIVSQRSPSIEVEILAMDDGSIDLSGRMLEDFASKNVVATEVHLFDHQGVSHLARRMNRLVESARGDFLAFLSADDFYLPGAFERAVRSMSHNQKTAAVFSNGFDGSDLCSAMELHRGLDLLVLKLGKPLWLNMHLPNRAPRIFLQASLFRMSVLRDFVLFDASLIADDWVALIRSSREMMKMDYGFEYHDYPVVFRRRLPSSTSNNASVHSERVRQVANNYCKRADSIISDRETYLALRDVLVSVGSRSRLPPETVKALLSSPLSVGRILFFSFVRTAIRSRATLMFRSTLVRLGTKASM